MQEAGAHAIEEAAESEDALRPIKKRARAVMESESEEEEQEEQEEEESLACDECGEERTCELILKYKGVLVCPGCKHAACSATATAAAAARKAENLVRRRLLVIAKAKGRSIFVVGMERMIEWS